MVVLIAEKPSVGQELARITGCRERGDGFCSGGRLKGGPLDGRECCVTWAIGHLVELVQSDEDAALHWKLENLPVIPKEYHLEPARKEGTKKPDPGYVKQLKVIQKLFSQSEAIINCGDAGREGEVIQRYIHEYVIGEDRRCDKPVWRMWTSSMTDEALSNGLRDVRPSSEYDNLFEAGRLRNMADQLVGFNATEVLTIRANVPRPDGKGRLTLSLGRVQTPVLALVCARYLENKNFKPVPFWTVRVGTSSKGVPFVVRSDRRFDTFGEAESLAKRCKVSMLKVEKVERKAKKEQAPLLHDITSIQQEASKRYGFNPDETLGLVQELYDAKLVTYPRTGSRFIPEDVFGTIPERIANVAANCPDSGLRDAAVLMKGRGVKELNRRSVDDGKVTDHHALLIEKTRPGSLSDKQAKIYNLIAQRMLEAFLPSCEMEVYSVKFSCAGEGFSASSTKVLKPGWKAVAGVSPAPVAEAQDDADGKEAEQKLPELREGEMLEVRSADTVQGQTKPKPLYTMDTLLEVMKTAGKESEDDEVKAAMKDIGIGTPATRAGIIAKLMSRDRQYIEKVKGKIVPTKRGLEIYGLVKDLAIANVELTGRWEVALGMVADGGMPPSQFKGLIEQFVKKLCAQLMVLEIGSAIAGTAAQVSVKCPVCGSPMRIYDTNAKCTNTECGLYFNRTVRGKKLSEPLVKTFLEEGKTPVLGGFVSKDGKSYSASLTLSVVEKDGRKYANADVELGSAKGSSSGGRGKSYGQYGKTGGSWSRTSKS